MNKLYVLAAALLLAASAQAQDIRQLFASAPDSLFLPVNPQCRPSMMSLADTCVEQKTVFGDSVIVRASSDTFISYSFQGSAVQLRLDDAMIVAAYTHGGENAVSELCFYDTSWNLKASWIYGSKSCSFMPSDKDIYNNLVVKPDEMSEKDFERLKKYLDPMLVSAALTDVKGTVSLKVSAPLLSDDEKKELETILKQKTFKLTM